MWWSKKPGYSYEDAHNEYDDAESSLESGFLAIEADIVNLCRNAMDFGLDPEAGLIVREARQLFKDSSIDRDLLVSRHRIKTVFSFQGKSRKNAPESLGKLVQTHLTHVQRICRSFQECSERLVLAKKVIERYKHLRDEQLSFRRELVLASPEFSEVLFEIWEHRTTLVKQRLALFAACLSNRAANGRRWFSLLDDKAAVPERPLKELEGTLQEEPIAPSDTTDMRRALHLHQFLDVFLQSLDWESEKETAKTIKVASRPGWEKLSKRGGPQFALKELGKVYKRPPRKKGNDTAQPIGRKYPLTRSIGLLTQVYSGSMRSK